MTCTADGTATAGQYVNEGCVAATTPGGMQINDCDPSHYFGADPQIDIEKATNGEDADVAPGPTVPVGSPVTWTYVVTNTGNVPLADVAVTDDKLGAITCPTTSLAPTETMTCSADGTAMEGQYANLATVAGTTGHR